MTQAKAEHSISMPLPTVCAALSITECRSLYFAAVAACEAFIGAENKPNAAGGVGDILDGYVEAMSRLYEEIASEIEAKRPYNDRDAESKFEVLMDWYSNRVCDYAKAAEVAVQLLPQLKASGRN